MKLKILIIAFLNIGLLAMAFGQGSNYTLQVNNYTFPFNTNYTKGLSLHSEFQTFAHTTTDRELLFGSVDTINKISHLFVAKNTGESTVLDLFVEDSLVYVLMGYSQTGLYPYDSCAVSAFNCLNGTKRYLNKINTSAKFHNGKIIRHQSDLIAVLEKFIDLPTGALIPSVEEDRSLVLIKVDCLTGNPANRNSILFYNPYFQAGSINRATAQRKATILEPKGICAHGNEVYTLF